MIILGVVLLVVGLLVKGLAVLATIGVVVLVIGAILAILGDMGRAVGGRKHYYCPGQPRARYEDKDLRGW